jgi:hypothetical protein
VSSPLRQDETSPSGEPRIINIVEDFLTFWDHAQGASLRRQRRLWMRLVENKHRDYFEKAVYRELDDFERRILLDQFLLRVPWHIDAIREFNETAPEVVAQGLLDFTSRFPEYQHQRDIYIGLSMFRFDGSVRPLHNDSEVPDSLCLGAELLSEYSIPQLQIVIVHELFHLYHFGFLMQDINPHQLRTAHMPLMIEGMAVAGTEAVYPYESPSLYLHFSDEALSAQEEFLAFNSRRFLRLLGEGTTPDQYAPWFTDSIEDRVPRRGGYLLGYEVARRVLGSYNLEQMVRMRPGELREHAEEQLIQMSSDEIFLLASGN